MHGDIRGRYAAKMQALIPLWSPISKTVLCAGKVIEPVSRLGSLKRQRKPDEVTLAPDAATNYPSSSPEPHQSDDVRPLAASFGQMSPSGGGSGGSAIDNTRL